MNREPQVVVIIPTYNDSTRLKLCLDALANQTYPLEKLRVCVVDNNSTENIHQVTQAYPFCEYLQETAPGSYCARNRALQQIADQDCCVAFTDSDCIPAPDWVANAVTRLQASPEQALGGRVEVFARDEHKPNLIELYEMLVGFPQRQNVEQNHFAVTANLFTTSEVIRRNGEFDASLFSGGDLEWGTRLRINALSLQYADDVVVRHPARFSLSQIEKKIRRTTGGHYSQRQKSAVCARRFSAYSLLSGFLPPIKAIPKIFSMSPKVDPGKGVALFLLMTYLKFYQTWYALLYVAGVKKVDERF